MDTDIFDIIKKTGFQVRRIPVTIDLLTEYHFAIKSYRLLQQFCAHSQKHHKNLIFTEYFVKNLNQNFRNKVRKQQEEEISKYISILLEKDKSTEIEIYYNLMFNSVNIKTGKLYLALFSDIKSIASDLYETPQKMFRNIKIDIQKALDIAYGQLKGDVTIEAFTSSLTQYIETHGTNKSYIPGSIVVNFVVLAYLSSHNYLSAVDYKSSPLWLDWSSNNAFVFIVKANKDNKETVVTENDLEDNDGNGAKDNGKLNRKNKAFVDKNEYLLGKSDGNSNLVKICHPFVFNNDHIDNHKNQGTDIRKDILVLRNKLEKQRLEYNIQQNLWKIILYHLKNTFSAYSRVEEEFESINRINEVLSSVLNRNTEEWRSIFHEKKEIKVQSSRYLYLISSLLEGLDQNIHKDLQTLNLSDDNEASMISLFEKLETMDLSKYFDMDETEDVSEIPNKKDEHSANCDTRQQSRSIMVNKMAAFEHSKVNNEENDKELASPNAKRVGIDTVNVKETHNQEDIKERSKTLNVKVSHGPVRESKGGDTWKSTSTSLLIDSRKKEQVNQLKENLGKIKQKFNEESV